MPTTVLVIQPDAAAGKDSYVRTPNNDVNYGNGGTLAAGTNAILGITYRALIQFDLSAIPANATILSAKLELYCHSVDWPNNSISLILHRITSAWTELGVTWNNQPTIESQDNATAVVNNTGWVTWNIHTQTIHEWRQGTFVNNGMLIKKLTEALSGVSQALFISSDDTNSPTLRPKLTVTYAIPPSAGITAPNGTQAAPTTIFNSLTPTLQGTYTDADNDPQAQGQWQVFNEVGTLVHDSGYIANTNASYVVPAGVLALNTKYRWQWRAKDNYGIESAWSASGWFTLSTSVPVTGITNPAGQRGNPTALNNVLTSTMTGTYFDPGSVAQAHAQFQLLDEVGNLLYDSTKIATTATTHTCPANLLVYGKKYFWRWMAWNTIGTASPWSSSGGWIAPQITAPTNLIATANRANIDLIWTPVAAEELTGYNIYRNGVKINELAVTDSSYIDDAPASGVNYSYTVRAFSVKTAVRSGYESLDSVAIAATATYASRWFGSTEINWDRDAGLQLTKQQDAPVKYWLQKKMPTVFRTSRSMKLPITFYIQGEAAFQSFLAEWEQDKIFPVKDGFTARVWRVKPMSEMVITQLNVVTATGDTIWYRISFEAIEVA